MSLDDLIDELEERGFANAKRILRSATMEILEDGRSLDELLADPFYSGGKDPETVDLLRRAIALRAGLDVEVVQNGPGIRLTSRQWLDEFGGKVDWFHWNRYREVLAANGWNLPAIMTIQETSWEILSNTPAALQEGDSGGLQATTEGFVDWRGLIVGHVQSGKTAMFTGLICRCCDVGYRLIIILAGMNRSAPVA